MDLEDALHRLNAACPEYQDVWRDRQTRDRTEGLGPPEEFVQTNDLANWVVARTAAKQYSCLAELFAEVELLLSTGSHEVREVVTIGLLEDIQDGLADHQISRDESEHLLRFFGPLTQQAWLKIASWRGRR